MLRPAHPSGRTGHDGGSALVLMPAAVLVLIVLAAICVDLSAVQLRQRELVVAAQAAANDAAAVAFDEAGFYDDGIVALDARTARHVAAASLAANAPEAVIDGFRVDAGSATVEIRVAATAATVFARGLPGGPRTVALRARARAALER